MIGGLSSKGIEKVEEIVESFFDKMIYRFLGHNPNSKKIEFFVKRPDETLLDLFINSLNGKPNEVEQDMAKRLLKSSYNYFAALREKTKGRVADKIQSALSEANLKGSGLTANELGSIISEEMDKAKSHFNMITTTESTRAKNLGHAMFITRTAAAEGDTDPNIYFVIKKDLHTCKFCINNHLHPDGRPKVFKLSELKQGYLSAEDRNNGDVSINGQHNNCRCRLVYIGKHFGFDKNNKISFIDFGHDEYAHQQSLYSDKGEAK